MKILLSIFSALFLTACTAAPLGTLNDGKTDFLKALDRAWALGAGGSGVDVLSAALSSGGRRISLELSDHGQKVFHTFLYESQADASHAYYRNIIMPAPGIRLERFVGLKIENNFLIWVNYKSLPAPADYPRKDAAKIYWDNFNAKWWGKDRIDFTAVYAVIGK